MPSGQNLTENSLVNLKPWKPGQSGNPSGPKPGYKHISTWVNELLNDEEFTVENFEFSGKKYKGAPMKAIIQTAIHQALSGDVQWARWLSDNLKTQGDIGNVTTNINFINVTGRPDTRLPSERETE